jgi:hypothetical protein
MQRNFSLPEIKNPQRDIEGFLTLNSKEAASIMSSSKGLSTVDHSTIYLTKPKNFFSHHKKN